ncbi:glycosyltransferase family 4 protein [Halorientalis marina]|uniref:glycosyltransferase family 4 protein n=1 Tax=Halorientalis marina TaxID=2931976 RepID=UPI001FF673ED|nr:glycosyltransferase family 4 protein [Halorientalis marina]
MRVVIIPFGFFSENLDSPRVSDFTAPLIADRAELIAEEFESVTLIAGWRDGESAVRWADGNKYVTVRTTGRASIARYLYRAIRELRSLRQEDIVVVNFNPHIPGCLLAAYCRSVDISFLTYFIGLPEGTQGMFNKQIYTFQYLLKHSDGRICPTPESRDRLRELANVPIDVVPNGVHPMFDVDETVDTEENMLLYVGRFAPEKRLPLLLSAFATVRERGIDARLVLVGARSASKREEIESLAHDLGIGSSVEVHGRIPREEVPTWMNRARSVVLPSRDEGFGMVLIEAMACGTPPIGMNSGSVPWVIDDAGAVCEDQSELSDAMERMLTDEDYYRVRHERSLKRAAEFSRNRWRQNIYDAIQNAVSD